MNDEYGQHDRPGHSGQYADASHRYRLDSRIATGGMGVVWRATDTRLHREVAVKVLKEEFTDDPTFRARFDTEARNAASLHHPNIAGVFDYDADPADGRAPFLVMEFVDGKPLSALLVDGRQLDPDVVRDLLAQAADGLAVAHSAGIVHRDVKPANLVVTADGTIKVTDFGIARAGEAAPITRTGAVMGTPQYLSPEQAQGHPATPASDVYSLGVVAYEALVGVRPFEAESPVATILAHSRDPVPELPAAVPDELAAVVRRAMAKDPAERFPDAAAFARALRDPSAMPAVAAAATSVLPTTSEQPVDGLAPAAAYAGTAADDDRRKKGKVWPIVLLVVLLVAAAALVGWLLLSGDGEEEPDVADTPSQTTSAPTTETTETATEPAAVQVDESDYVGRDIDQVASELRDRGFETAFSEINNDGSEEADTVAGLDPHGSVQEGSVITIDYYGPPPETESPTPTPTPTPSPTPTTTAPTSPTSPTSATDSTSALTTDGTPDGGST